MLQVKNILLQKIKIITENVPHDAVDTNIEEEPEQEVETCFLIYSAGLISL